MMGVQEPEQEKLFYTNIKIAERIRRDHPLRRIAAKVDFDFIYQEVADRYGSNGNVSVPPPIVLKLMLLLIFYNVRSERELMATLPERLDWLWFLGYDLDTKIPDHSILSKARRRWGEEIFKSFFERIVIQCVEAGLVDGSKIFVDSSLVEADASNNSVIDTQSLKHQLRKNYKELKTRLEERNENSEWSGSYRSINNRYISGTDPDATIVNRGKPDLCYQVHRAVDEAHEVITATETTPGDVSEANLMGELLLRHSTTTRQDAVTVVADSKYGTNDNFLACFDMGIRAHMRDLRKCAADRGAKRGIYPETLFHYDRERDIYICPAGKELRFKSIHQERQSKDYGARKKDCENCELRSRCTSNKMGRTVNRHLRQDDLDVMIEQSRRRISKSDIKKRQSLMERSFARGKRYGFDRARWRGLWKMRIQEYLTCAVQNIQVLLSRENRPVKNPAVTVRVLEPSLSRARSLFSIVLRQIRLTYIGRPFKCLA
jgi:transposase